ncbi:MAG: methyltransferase domain-containing protein [Anaerolineae bacterium]|nr:methyltransferase domain-containing protein [Anaerolineae bacterium]
MSDISKRAIAGFADVAASYDRTIAQEVERYCGMAYSEVLARVLEAASVMPDDRVLDVGTGTGALASVVAQSTAAGQVVAIDPTLQMLRRAQENAARAGLSARISFCRGSAEDLPFGNESFDVILTSMAMHHTDVRKTLAEVARVLRRGGRLAIADVARNPRWEGALGPLLRLAMAAYHLLSTRSLAITRAEMATYRQIFAKADWEAMLREAGFEPAAVLEFPHPSADWYSGVVLIRACREGAALATPRERGKGRA